MKKIIHEYQERNKVITEIQKNIRANSFRGPKSQPRNFQLNQNKFQNPNHIYNNHLDLPHITKKKYQPYSPKSHAQSLSKKKSASLIRDMEVKIQQSPKSLPNSPKTFIQTLTLKPGSEISNQNPKILLNRRITIKNFMRSSQLFNTQRENREGNQQIFLSPRKMMNLSKKQLQPHRTKYFSLDRRNNETLQHKSLRGQTLDPQLLGKTNKQFNKPQKISELFDFTHYQSYFTKKNHHHIAQRPKPQLSAQLFFTSTNTDTKKQYKTIEYNQQTTQKQKQLKQQQKKQPQISITQQKNQEIDPNDTFTSLHYNSQCNHNSRKKLRRHRLKQYDYKRHEKQQKRVYSPWQAQNNGIIQGVNQIWQV